MRVFGFLIFITFYSNILFAQLYNYEKSSRVVYIDIKGDTAYVELFTTFRYNFVYKEFDDILIFNKNNNSYVGKKTYALKKGDNIKLFLKFKNKKTNKFKLKKCKKDNRNRYRKLYYFSKMETQIRNLRDSLSYPNNNIDIDIRINYEGAAYDESVSDKDYFKKVNFIANSLTNRIKELKSPKIDSIYEKINLISDINETEIHNLLANADFNFKYAEYLIYMVSILKPESLISYVDKEPKNKKLVLKAIKNHNKIKEIHESIKKTNINTIGKKQILKQKNKKVFNDVVTVTTYVGIIVSEIAGLTWAVIYMF